MLPEYNTPQKTGNPVERFQFCGSRRLNNDGVECPRRRLDSNKQHWSNRIVPRMMAERALLVSAVKVMLLRG